MGESISVSGIQLQEKPLVYFSILPGPWLLKHTTPSWRIKDPEKGFQRIVKEIRARQIAAAVLDEQRIFPSAIVLSTDSVSFELRDYRFTIPSKTKFLVVDGQHRLWAQKFSKFDAQYACIIHMDLTEERMARLFLEINDNQKRVPSSLRWDLVRLVRPVDDPHAVTTAELIYELTTDDSSPLYHGVDLTGEQAEVSLKQGSLAPEIKFIISAKQSPLRDLDFDAQFETLKKYISAIRDIDPDGWRKGLTPFYQARVMRALLRFLLDIIKHSGKGADKVTVAEYGDILKRIDPKSLETDEIKAVQGSAGIKQIYYQIHKQVFPKKGTK